MSQQTRVGFVGLGMMGKPMARRVLQGGYPLTVYDIRLEPVEELAREGARKAGSAKEVAEASEVVVTSLPSLKASEEVYLGPEGLLAGAAPGSLLIETSTVPPRLVKELAAEGEKRGVTVIDASISGGKPGQGAGAHLRAAEGKLTVMVGASPEAWERARPVLGTFGDPVLHMGPLGTGALTKVINNAMGQANFLIAAEAIAAGVALGGDLTAMHSAIKDSSGSSVMFDFMMEPFFRTGSLSLMGVDLAIKDCQAIIEVGQEAGTPMFLHGAKVAYFEWARRRFGGDMPWGEAVLKMWEELLGKEIRFQE